jgi:hypothetical protein
MNDLKFTTAGNYMNSKIDDFIYQSGLIAAGCWDKFDDYDKKAIEKFGKLIVKECLDNMKNCDGDLDFAIWKTKKDFEINI